ncbi:hypothetical protein Tco_1115681, partial [Tanacetum coccineum]
MDTLSEVLEYLNEMENMLDDGDSTMRMEELIKVGKAELEKVDNLDTLVGQEVMTEKMTHEVVVFTKAPSREYYEPFMRFSMPCGVEVDFGLGEMRIDITMLKEDRDVDSLLTTLVEDMVEIEEMSSEVVKMGKASRIKNYNVNKLTPPNPLKIEEIPPPSSSTPQPGFHPLLPKQKEKILEALDRKYKELKEDKPILEVLDNYMVYRKKLDEVMMGRSMLKNKYFREEEKERIVKNGLPKKLSDLGNFVLPIRVNGTTQLSALADTRASVSVMAYSLYKNIVDRELPLLLGRLFLRTCGALIDMGRDEDWLGCFEVRRDEDGNTKYGPVALMRHLEEIHVTWTQFGKKHDKIATLHEDDEELVYRSYSYSNLDKLIWLAETLKKGSPFTSDSETNETPLRPYQLWKKARYEEALRKSDQMHQTFEKSSLAMTHKFDDMIGLPKSQPKKAYKEDLEYEMVMVKIPREVPSFDESGPQPRTLPSCPPLHVSLGDKKVLEPPIKPHNPDSFRMKVIDPLTIHTPPSPHMVSFYPKDVYCYYHPCIDDPKKHYQFKPERGDGVAIIKRLRQDLHRDGVRDPVTASGRGRLKEDLESSTWRRRHNFKATPSR